VFYAWDYVAALAAAGWLAAEFALAQRKEAAPEIAAGAERGVSVEE